MKFFTLPLVLLMVTSCSGLFYQPTAEKYSTPDQFKIKYESYFFPSPIKTSSEPQESFKLHGWHLLKSAAAKETPSAPKSTVVFLHGNAQNLTAHFMYPAWLTQHGHDVFIFDYKGYGQSEGFPSQAGTHQDALAALEFAYQLHLKRGAGKFIVWGHSLGGIIALRAIPDFPHRDKIDLVVIESSFSSYKDLAFKKMQQIWIAWPFSPLAYLLFSDEMAAKPFLDKIAPIPLLVIHGDDDEVVPAKFGREIYDRAARPKAYWEIKGAGHGDIFHSHKDWQINRNKILEMLAAPLASIK